MGLASHPAAEESDRTGKAPHARAIYANGREVNEPSDAHFSQAAIKEATPL